MIPADLTWLRGLAQCDSPIAERVVDPERVKRLHRTGLIDRNWVGSQWMLSLSRTGRRALEARA